jgi:hypothetical protein
LEERHTHQLPQICKLHGDLIEINKSITERLGGTVLNETWIPSTVSPSASELKPPPPSAEDYAHGKRRLTLLILVGLTGPLFLTR